MQVPNRRRFTAFEHGGRSEPAETRRGSELEPFVVGSRLRVCFDPGERSVVYLAEASLLSALGPE